MASRQGIRRRSVQALLFALANVTVENPPYSSGSEATLSTGNGIQSFVWRRTHFPRLICD
jgi:hypothetical protein